MIFKSANAGYGVAVDDYMDLPFVVKKVPFTVVYFIDNSKSNRLNYEIVRSPSDTVSLTPVFYDLNGQEITSVATQTGQWKFTVSYKRYNPTPPAAWENATPMGAGLYRVIVTFTQDAEIETGYTITSGKVITRDFQIITDGVLTVTPYRGGVCYYTGSAVEPELLFLAAGERDASVFSLYS